MVQRRGRDKAEARELVLQKERPGGITPKNIVIIVIANPNNPHLRIL
jgi:hypothetical protein